MESHREAQNQRVFRTLHAVVSHQFGPNWKIAMNGYNLANRLNYGNLFSNRVTPSVGRSFLFNLSMTY